MDRSHASGRGHGQLDSFNPSWLDGGVSPPSFGMSAVGRGRGRASVLASLVATTSPGPGAVGGKVVVSDSDDESEAEALLLTMKKHHQELEEEMNKMKERDLEVREAMQRMEEKLNREREDKLRFRRKTTYIPPFMQSTVHGDSSQGSGSPRVQCKQEEDQGSERRYGRVLQEQNVQQQASANEQQLHVQNLQQQQQLNML